MSPSRVSLSSVLNTKPPSSHTSQWLCGVLDGQSCHTLSGFQVFATPGIASSASHTASVRGHVQALFHAALFDACQFNNPGKIMCAPTGGRIHRMEDVTLFSDDCRSAG